MNKKSVLLLATLSLGVGTSILSMNNTPKKQDISFIANHLAQWAPNKTVTGIQELKGGLGGARLYTVTFDLGDPYVARLLVGSFARERAWQETEISVMKAAAQAGIGPDVIAAESQNDNNSTGYIVMQKVDIAHPATIPWDKHNLYETLGNFLRKMHAQPSIVTVDKESMYRRMYSIMDHITKKWNHEGNAGLAEQFNNVAQFFQKAYPFWTRTERTHLVHGDLLLSNLLYDGDRFWAIDWEQSRLVANPLFDTAVVHDSMVPDAYSKDFMQGYCESDELPSPKREELIVIRTLSSCFIGLAYACSMPTDFAHKFNKYTAEKVPVDVALNDIMRSGFKLDTRDNCVTFGTLLFARGYQGLQPERVALLHKALEVASKTIE